MMQEWEWLAISVYQIGTYEGRKDMDGFKLNNAMRTRSRPIKATPYTVLYINLEFIYVR